MNNILWSEERGPFMCGMVMCEDALYINTGCGSFRISGKGLRVKLLKERMPIKVPVETGLRQKVEVEHGKRRWSPNRVTPWRLF